MLAQAGHGAHRIKEVGKQQGENEQDGGNHADFRECAYQVHIAHNGQVRNPTERFWFDGRGHAPVLGAGKCLHDKSDDGGEHDGDKKPARHIPDNHEGTDNKADDKDQRRPSGNRSINAQAHRHGGMRSVRHAGDKTTVHKADHGDEHADAYAHRRLHGLRDGVEDGGAETGNGQQNDDDALDNHQTHRFLPGQPTGGNHAHAHEGIHAQAGGHGEGVFGNSAEEDRHYARDQRGGGSNLRHAQRVAVCIFGGAEDQRIQENDIGHGEERDRSRA